MKIREEINELNEINATNLQQTGFCNKSNKYNVIVACVND